MLDASGQVAPGFVWGNNYWLGSNKECERINDPTKVVLSESLAKNHLVNLTEIASPFPVEYKISWAKHESRWQLDINTFEKVRKGRHRSDSERIPIININLRIFLFHYRHLRPSSIWDCACRDHVPMQMYNWLLTKC